MQTPSNGYARKLAPNLVGFALAVILTAIPFALVYFHALARTPALIVIAGLAVVQILVHLRYFLHLDMAPASRSKLFSLVFAAVLVFLMVGGTVWIMFDLSMRMGFG